MSQVAWWNPETQTGVTLDLAELFSKSNLSEKDMKICYRLMVRYIVRGNRVGILAVALYLIGSTGIGGKTRKDLLEAVGGSSKKIMETIQTQRTRKIQAGTDAAIEGQQEEEDQ
jgi:hypothetical protein